MSDQKQLKVSLSDAIHIRNALKSATFSGDSPQGDAVTSFMGEIAKARSAPVVEPNTRQQFTRLFKLLAGASFMFMAVHAFLFEKDLLKGLQLLTAGLVMDIHDTLTNGADE